MNSNPAASPALIELARKCRVGSSQTGKSLGRLVLGKSGVNDHCAALLARSYLPHRNNGNNEQETYE
jgi:hypothetical protein